MERLQLKSQSTISRIADMMMVPTMYLLQFNMRETPQRTHRWNNVRMDASCIRNFQSRCMVTISGDTDAVPRWIGPFPIFHMPIFGGWSEFVVIEPVEKQDIWYIGWLPFDVIGVSQLPLSNSVRVLIGPRQVQFFGVNEQGEQIAINIVGKGMVGKAGEYSEIPLL